MEVDGDLLRTMAQPIWNQAWQQVIPLLLQFRDSSGRQLLSQVAAHGIGIRRASQVGTGGLKRRVARGGGEQQAPQIAGLAAVAIRREWNVALRNSHGIMQSLLVGQTDRLGRWTVRAS